MKKVAGVMGQSRNTTSEQEEAAKELGREIAKAGVTLLTGATTGLPEKVAAGAKSEGGHVIGISPARNSEEHTQKYGMPLDNMDDIIFTGFGLKGRNLVNIRTSNVVFFIAGQIGTLNEFTLAYEEKKPIGILTGFGGITDKIQDIMETLGPSGATIIYDSNPKALVEKLLK